MSNEIILAITLALTYSSVVLFYKFIGRTGLYVWTVLATITANIEVLILIDAFGMEQTLGNVLFASTFLVTDILSETESKESATNAAKLGIVVSIVFILISQSWFLYTPNANDWASPAIEQVFSNTPRLMLVSISVYAIAQIFDVFAYHTIWKHTTKLFKDKRKGLWIRNNGSTLLSQLLNTILFNFGAFYGLHSFGTVVNICISSYVIYVVTSILDTPAVYIARKISESGKANSMNF